MGTRSPWEEFRQALTGDAAFFDIIATLVAKSETPTQGKDVERLLTILCTLGHDPKQEHHVQNTLVLVSRWTRRLGMMHGCSRDESNLAQQLADQCTAILLQDGRDICSRRNSLLFRCLAELSVVLRTPEDKERVWMNLVDLLLAPCHPTSHPNEWWPNVCSGVVYCVGYSLRCSENYAESAAWLLTMMLCCSSVIELNQPYHTDTLISIFTSTSAAFLEPCHQVVANNGSNTIHMWYGVLRSSRLGMEENASQRLCSPVVLLACYTAMLDVIAPKAEFQDMLHSIVKDIMGICHWGRLNDGNFDAIFSSSLALSRVHTKSPVPWDLATALCLLESYAQTIMYMNDSRTRVPTAVDTQPHDRALRDACFHAIQHCVSIQGVHMLQPPILGELQSISNEFYMSQIDAFARTKRMNLQVGHDLFHFAIGIIEIVTKQASVLKPTSLGSIVQCFGYLQLWRMSNSSAYRTNIRNTLQALPTQPKEAEEVAASLFPDGFQGNDEYLKNPVVLARLQFILFMLQPCIDALPEPLLVHQLADTCLSLLSVDHAPLAEASNDLLCSMLSQTRSDPRQRRILSISFIEKSFEAVVAHSEEEHIQAWKNRFTQGISILAANTPDTDSQCVYLEETLEKCSGLLQRDLSHAVPAAFESAAHFLQHMSIENIPNACRQLQAFLCTIQQSECHRECCASLFRVIQESQDITRVPYLAQHYMAIIGEQ